MEKYINADRLLKNLPNDLPYKGSVRRVLIQAPAADVVEMKHGYWIDLNITEWQCSECNYRVERWNNTPYCPDCGAKMDGGKEE